MKIMAIDYGDAHTGIAISDATGTLAGFTTVIDSENPKNNINTNTQSDGFPFDFSF